MLLLDRGFAFSQEAGQAPQITDNLFKKLKMGLSNKYSFIPRVTSSTHQYSPNLEALQKEEEVLRGSFNPEYQLMQTAGNLIQDNYFNEAEKAGEEVPQYSGDDELAFEIDPRQPQSEGAKQEIDRSSINHIGSEGASSAEIHKEIKQ